MRFECGIEIRDSLILSQTKLEKWANDLQVEHRKAVGKWNYNKFRSQKTKYKPDELEYIEHDTLAGVECIDATMHNLGKKVYSMPFTSTGIIRKDIQELLPADAVIQRQGGKYHRQDDGHDTFHRQQILHRNFLCLIHTFSSSNSSSGRSLLRSQYLKSR